MVTQTPATPATSATTNKRRWLTGDRLRNQITGMLFVAPASLLIGVFGLFPITYAIYMSFHSWRIQRRYTLCLPEFAANWRAEAPVWEKDFLTEVVPNFRLGSCFDNYTEIVGNWWGVLLWILGFVGLFFAFIVWTRVFREDSKSDNRWVRVITMAFFIGMGILVAVLGLGQLGVAGLPDLTPIVPHIQDISIGSLAGVVNIGLGALCFGLAFLVMRNPEWADNLPVRLFTAFIPLLVALYWVSNGWGMMISTGDEDYLQGIIYTFYYAVGSIPVQLSLGLILAYVLYRNIWGKELWRMLFFLPYVTPAVAAAVVFRIVLSPRETSLANSIVTSLGFGVQRWTAEPAPFLNAMFGLNLEGFLAGPSMALVSVIILGIWTYTGYNAVIFLAGMGGIPGDLYEAARVDGASEYHLFRYITLPLLSPVTFYLSVLGFIGTFKAFNTLYVMRLQQGLGTTDTASIVVFDTFFKASRYGVATAQAILLLLIILAITQFQRSVLEKRVFYG
ncbi:MAG: sugar ABC transporter permease [Anaerolineaceae bacterium]|nr:sugar ABC transporter permease [Anaerolineae bacterium]MCB9460195.1 sugar ABC transporter permease [Anaerolineaceae bacterium]